MYCLELCSRRISPLPATTPPIELAQLKHPVEKRKIRFEDLLKQYPIARCFFHAFDIEDIHYYFQYLENASGYDDENYKIIFSHLIIFLLKYDYPNRDIALLNILSRINEKILDFTEIKKKSININLAHEKLQRQVAFHYDRDNRVEDKFSRLSTYHIRMNIERSMENVINAINTIRLTNNGNSPSYISQTEKLYADAKKEINECKESMTLTRKVVSSRIGDLFRPVIEAIVFAGLIGASIYLTIYVSKKGADAGSAFCVSIAWISTLLYAFRFVILTSDELEIAGRNCVNIPLFLQSVNFFKEQLNLAEAFYSKLPILLEHIDIAIKNEKSLRNAQIDTIFPLTESEHITAQEAKKVSNQSIKALIHLVNNIKSDNPVEANHTVINMSS